MADYYIAGHSGLVGSALTRYLRLVGKDYITRNHIELDLCNQEETFKFFEKKRPKKVIVAAGTVGGILPNSTRPAEFLYNNLMIAANVIEAAYRYGVEKLLYLGSSCIYPRNCPQPMKEEYLLTGPFEPTNEGYAVAKVSGIKLCQYYKKQYGCNFISAIPTNLYGPNDNFDLETSHALPAMIRKFHENREKVIIWGSGIARREFMYSNDCADALMFLMDNYNGVEPVNIGTGVDHSILETAEIIKSVVGSNAVIELDKTKPDGMPRKLLDISNIKKLGWEPQYSLEEGIRNTYKWFKEYYV